MSDQQSGTGFKVQSSIPILRMFDENLAKSFYFDYLGYELIWEHRFDPDSNDSPLYMQIQLGDSVLHLDGHATEETPRSMIRIPVENLEAYWQHLQSRSEFETPEIADPRYEGRQTDLNLLDPFENFLIFWQE